MTDEVWKPAVGYEGFYDVSNQGRVRSVTRRVPYKRNPGNHTKLVPRKILKQGKNNRGYLYAVFSIEGKRIQRAVSHLVLDAFIGARPENKQACHNNGIKSDNYPSNLRWDTAKNNCADRILHGTQKRGEEIKCAKLTETDVMDIRSSNVSGAALGRKYNVTRSTISGVRKRKTWKHLR